MQSVKANVALMAVIVLGGCYANVEPPEPAYSQMQELCTKNGGLHVLASPVEVEGFFEEGGRGCGNYCRAEIRDGYAFIEARADQIDIAGYALRPGLYRFSLKPGGHPSCEAFYQRSQTPLEKRMADRPCIGAELIDRAASKYRVGQSFKRERIGAATFVTRYDWIEEIGSGRKLAEIYVYSLHWEGVAGLPGRGDRLCPRNNPTLPVKSILIPVQR